MKFITVEATIDERGNLHVDDEVDLKGKRVLITVLPDDVHEPMSSGGYTALMSQRVLARYWDTPEEDEAWAYLQDSDEAEEGNK